MSEVLNLI